MVKLLLVIFSLFFSYAGFCQTSILPIYKYESDGKNFKVTKGSPLIEKYSEGHRLIVVNLREEKVYIDADNVELFISKMEMKNIDDKMIIILKCKDTEDLTCEFVIFHEKNKPEMISLKYDTFQVSYFISKQIQ